MTVSLYSPQRKITHKSALGWSTLCTVDCKGLLQLNFYFGKNIGLKALSPHIIEGNPYVHMPIIIQLSMLTGDTFQQMDAIVVKKKIAQLQKRLPQCTVNNII